MTGDPSEWISRYFDDLLTDDDLNELQRWICASPDHAQRFARSALLHDRLRSEQLAIPWVDSPVNPPNPVGASKETQRASWRSWVISFCVIVAFIVLGGTFWESGRSQVIAATELKRLISAHESQFDKTYLISVEDAPTPPRKRPRDFDNDRPPKPPLDKAILHVRHGNQFVLMRTMLDGQLFVTGSNGRTSWAVRPDGPVRVSSDLTRFNRDLPGHEHEIPLIDIKQGLTHLQEAYEIELLPIESNEEAGDIPEATRLLVAVKKRGQRGPQRVEITYVVSTGQIRQLRFVGMPYGPEHLTVRLSLMDEVRKDASFYDHDSHHAPDRRVEEE
jgi:hypothetical protein